MLWSPEERLMMYGSEGRVGKWETFPFERMIEFSRQEMEVQEVGPRAGALLLF